MNHPTPPEDLCYVREPITTVEAALENLAARGGSVCSVLGVGPEIRVRVPWRDRSSSARDTQERVFVEPVAADGPLRWSTALVRLVERVAIQLDADDAADVAECDRRYKCRA